MVALFRFDLNVMNISAFFLKGALARCFGHNITRNFLVTLAVSLSVGHYHSVVNGHILGRGICPLEDVNSSKELIANCEVRQF